MCMNPPHLNNVLASLYHQRGERKIGTDVFVKLVREQP